MILLEPTSSAGIQAALNKIGDGFKEKVLKLADGTFKIDKPLVVNDGTEFCGSGYSLLKLVNYASRKIFAGDPDGKIVPIIGQKKNTIKDITIHDLVFDGSSAKQTVPHGKNYHNFIFFQYGQNIKTYDLEIRKSQGDGVRLRNCDGVFSSRIKVDKCGHDGIHCRNSKNIRIDDIKCTLRINSAVRLINCSDAKISNVRATGYNSWEAGGPGIQIEKSGNASGDNIETKNIEVFNCNLTDTYGPGMWIVSHGKYSGNKNLVNGVHVHHCVIDGCGLNPNIDWTAGILWSGWDGVLIENCIIKDCNRAGIIGQTVKGCDAVGKDYQMTVRNNIVVGTNGIGMANDTTNGIITAKYNDVYNSKLYRNIKGNNNLSKDPLFASETDFHLKSIAGRWTGNGWVKDTVHSPCIDTGNPTNSHDNEPMPNGGVINMGIHGNTIEASKSVEKYIFVNIS